MVDDLGLVLIMSTDIHQISICSSLSCVYVHVTYNFCFIYLPPLFYIESFVLSVCQGKVYYLPSEVLE